jgi:proteasome beta subunit
MIRGNLGAAMQGHAAVPLFAGYDLAITDPADAGRILSFDVAGGLYPEQHYAAVGSGSVFAKSSLKKLWSPQQSREDIVRIVTAALYDAADDDSATGGPDLQRNIYPVIMLATVDGVSVVSETEQEPIVNAVLAERRLRPGS